MRQATLIAAAAAALMTTACAASSQQEFTKQDAATIRQRNDAFVQAFNAKKISQLADLYADNSVFMPPNQPIIRGRGLVSDFYQNMVNHGATDLRLDVASIGGHGPIAYQTGTYEMDYKPAHGTVSHDRGKYLFVLRNVGGTWRYEYTMWNSDLPSASPTGVAD